MIASNSRTSLMEDGAPSLSCSSYEISCPWWLIEHIGSSLSPILICYEECLQSCYLQHSHVPEDAPYQDSTLGLSPHFRTRLEPCVGMHHGPLLHYLPDSRLDVRVKVRVRGCTREQTTGMTDASRLHSLSWSMPLHTWRWYQTPCHYIPGGRVPDAVPLHTWRSGTRRCRIM